MRYFTWKLEFASIFFEWLSMVSCLLTSAITVFSRAHGVMLTHMVFQINKTFFTQSFSSVSNEISLVLDHGHFQKPFCGNDGILVKISWLHNQNSYQKKIQTIVANFKRKQNSRDYMWLRYCLFFQVNNTGLQSSWTTKQSQFWVFIKPIFKFVFFQFEHLNGWRFVWSSIYKWFLSGLQLKLGENFWITF